MKTTRPTRLAWSYLRHHKWRLTTAVFWRSLYELVPMQVPLLTGIIVDGVVGGKIRLWGIDRDLNDPMAILQFAAAGFLLVEEGSQESVELGDLEIDAKYWHLSQQDLQCGVVNVIHQKPE